MKYTDKSGKSSIETDLMVYWVILVFGSLCLNLNLLIRTLDDPFDGPKEYHLRCYARFDANQSARPTTTPPNKASPNPNPTPPKP